MSTPRDRLSDLTRDLDMVVFRLEGLERRDPERARWVAEGRAVRRELERLRDQLDALSRGL